MWPFDRIFRKKVKPDISRLKEQDKEIPDIDDLEKQDAEFREESGVLVTKVLKKEKKL